MKNQGRKTSFVRLSLWLLVVVFILSVVPLFSIMVYSRPIGDDLVFSKNSHEAIIASDGLIEVIQAAANTTKQIYLYWQGTISAVFLMSLQPGIWNERFYGLGLAFIMLAFIFSVFFLVVTICKVFIPKQKHTSYIFAILILICCLQYVPFEMEGFYWFNGSIYYTFYFSLQCILFSLILRYYGTEKHTPSKMVLYFVGVLILCVIIGTGNYATALQTAVVLAACVIWSIFAKRFRWLILIAWLVFLASFALSALAPGNAARIAEESSHIGAGDPVRAILFALKNAFVYPQRWTKIPMLFLCAMALPFILNAARKTNYSYRMPLLVSVLSALYLAVGFVPTQYGQGLDGPLRFLDIQFHLFVILLFFNLFYWFGWIFRTFETQFNQFVPNYNCQSFVSFFVNNLRRTAIIYLCIAACLVIISGVIDREAVSLSASKSLINGEAQRYAQEYDERVEVLQNRSILNPVFTPFSAMPHVLAQDDLSSDTNYWYNTNIANYYGKESVRVQTKTD